MNRKRIRRFWIAAALLLAGGMVAASALGRWPIPGEEWGEWTYYDASGNAVGGRLVDCDGSIHTWGTLSGRLEQTLGQCH